MDILIHITSGMLMGSTLAAYNPFRRPHRTRLWLTSILLGGLAGALPDLDAISKWSKFDATIGIWFDLAPGDEIYSGRWWYSHHAFTHSLLASLLFSLFVYLITRAILANKETRKKAGQHNALVFFFGWTAHLVGDLPTPSGSWDGIAYFWPSTHYIGGTGHTFWWNNYDVFLLLVLCLTIQSILIFFLHKSIRWIGPSLTLICIILITFQLNDRPMDFNDRSMPYVEREKISLQYQQRVLGDRLFTIMSSFDAKLPVYF